MTDPRPVQPLTPARPVRGTLDPSEPVLPNACTYDRFAFRARAGQRITLALESDEFPPHVLLVAPGDRFLERRDPARAILQAEAPADGTYGVVCASGVPGRTGEYRVALRLEDAPSATPALAVTTRASDDDALHLAPAPTGLSPLEATAFGRRLTLWVPPGWRGHAKEKPGELALAVGAPAGPLAGAMFGLRVLPGRGLPSDDRERFLRGQAAGDGFRADDDCSWRRFAGRPANTIDAEGRDPSSGQPQRRFYSLLLRDVTNGPGDWLVFAMGLAPTSAWDEALPWLRFMYQSLALEGHTDFPRRPRLLEPPPARPATPLEGAYVHVQQRTRYRVSRGGYETTVERRELTFTPEGYVISEAVLPEPEEPTGLLQLEAWGRRWGTYEARAGGPLVLRWSDGVETHERWRVSPHELVLDATYRRLDVDLSGRTLEGVYRWFDSRGTADGVRSTDTDTFVFRRDGRFEQRSSAVGSTTSAVTDRIDTIVSSREGRAGTYRLGRGRITLTYADGQVRRAPLLLRGAPDEPDAFDALTIGALTYRKP